jgi:cyclophilin family peptidyl-prolyl cis-trans isomerase
MRVRFALLGALAVLVAVGCGPSPPPPSTVGSTSASPAAAPSNTAQLTSSSSVAQPPASPAVSAPTSRPLASPSANGVTASPAPVRTIAPVAYMQFPSPPAMTIDPAKRYSALLNTSLGPMTATLFASEVPLTTNNFVFLARQHFYDGVTFFRVINGVMVVTGDPSGTGNGGPGYQLKDEPVKRNYERGTLAMVTAGPDTGGSQFLIVQKDYPLPKSYTIFGQLTDGFDTLDKIATTPTTTRTTPTGIQRDVPVTPITITSIRIDES